MPPECLKYSKLSESISDIWIARFKHKYNTIRLNINIAAAGGGICRHFSAVRILWLSCSPGKVLWQSLCLHLDPSTPPSEYFQPGPRQIFPMFFMTILWEASDIETSGCEWSYFRAFLFSLDRIMTLYSCPLPKRKSAYEQCNGKSLFLPAHLFEHAQS